MRAEQGEIFEQLQECQAESTEVHEMLSELIPEFYVKLRSLKFHGDKKMNELLLKQINIF